MRQKFGFNKNDKEMEEKMKKWKQELAEWWKEIKNEVENDPEMLSAIVEILVEDAKHKMREGEPSTYYGSEDEMARTEENLKRQMSQKPLKLPKSLH